MNTNWTDADIDAAVGRIERSVSRKLRRRRRLHRGAVAAGVVAIGVTGIAAASTLLPPQNLGEIQASVPYITSVTRCLDSAGWNVWIAPSETLSKDTIHFSVNGYRQLEFSDDIERCRTEVARSNGVDVSDVIGLDD